jgi:cell division protein WhiA
MSFTATVRDELAHAPPGPDCCRAAETAALLRLGGALHLTDAGVGWVVTASSGAVVRRLHGALGELFAVRPEIEVHEPTGLQTTRYRLVLHPPVEEALTRIGVLDGHRRPLERPATSLTSAPHDAAAYVRGALMVAGSISDPRRPSHLEIAVPGAAPAEHLRKLVVRCGGTGAQAAQRQDEWRVVSKSGAAIGAVLARVGAHGAFLEWDGERLRRELRGEANRATNADQANLSRAADATARQVAAIEAAVRVHGWDGLPDDLRTTALARLANPQAALGELGALHDPPVAKATVHRRLARLARLSADPDPAAGDSPPG